ncbi:hypothetical protein XI06_15685 [Bradyrhizobium sp. CCBAU 11434]|nr:hypothetical protein [Bradyrhizobium sp. CCBAU 11434]
MISEFVNFLCDRYDRPLEKAPALGQVLNEPNHSSRQVILEHRENLWKSQSECCRSLPNCQPSLKQKTSDLIDDRRSLRHQSTANSVQRLQVKLLGRFQRDEAHGRALRRLCDGFGITEVILWPLRYGFTYYAGQEAYLVA